MSQYHDLLVALRKITRAIDMHSKKLAKDTGLTAPQLLVLQCVAGDKRAKPSDIARQVHLSQATITSIVDRLVRAGLVVRERNEHDRRSLEVVITDEGKRRLVDAPELLQEGFLSAFDNLADWEKSLLVSSMQKIAFMMHADNLDAAPILEVGDINDSGA
ncbi:MULTISPECIES: MarR family winged helix-turn-helix transcriptional regulator [Hyphomonas]|uniref:MarR family transcriptional regulator n=1 Tax=Hyphomonas adhaerens TaxID=81029 RepID=A0A3B9GU39_9PROT|nr:MULTISPECIES: MarR family transcriptional regulator [Hyphomonas]MBB41974.1 MarR family transcriptional regulator [Hyphomonas sp.]HAE25524.1 MarR family transcriptional regulator [Hyphomonas adhaerens]|tara:strand:+ start:112 stop:591 length:480 start_codon:yes stop_codon:yes gene_type:complete